MTNITLKQLRYFEAVAAESHFGRAASRCNISQPALSVQIRDLETELGAALFERGARAVTLTGFGLRFAQRVRPILSAVDELGDLARAAQGPLAGTVRLGVIPTVAPYLLPDFLARLPDSHPGLDVQVRETITPRLMDELRAGRIDAAIVALPVLETWVESVPIGTEDFVLVRPEEQSGTRAPRPEELASERVLLLEEGHCFRDQMLDVCGLAQGGPDGSGRGALDGSSLTTLVQMVAAKLGVTLIPTMAAPVEARRAAVDVVPFEGDAPGRTLGLVWRASSPLGTQISALAALFSDAMDRVVRQAAVRGLR